MPRIETKDAQGKPNGYVVTIWNANENPELRPEQVYVTAVAPHSQKGPHLHNVRRGLFYCIKGNVRVVMRDQGAYWAILIGDKHGFGKVEVKPGIAACLYNDSDAEALVLNLPSPAWSKDALDENPIEDWDPTRNGCPSGNLCCDRPETGPVEQGSEIAAELIASGVSEHEIGWWTYCKNCKDRCGCKV